MKKTRTPTFKKNIVDKNVRLEALIDQIQSSELDSLRIEALKNIFHINFGNYDLFTFLKEWALFDPSPEIRFLATKLLYEKYPIRSRDVVIWKLMHDEVFTIPIITLQEQNRMNFNDLVSSWLQKRKYQSQMVQDIIDTSLVNFFFKWKQYSKSFEVYYELYLKCFILINRIEKNIYYLCNTHNDPFNHLKQVKESSVSTIFKKYSLLTKLFTEVSNITLFRVISEEKKDCPSIKVYDESLNLSCYITENRINNNS